MADFMCLPPEIRKMIYEYCLIVNHTVGQCSIGNREDGSRRKCYCSVVTRMFGRHQPLKSDFSEEWNNAGPAVTLLVVNKTIGSEAAQVLYGNNTWQISSCSGNPIFPLSSNKSKLASLWPSRAPLFRHVALSFTTTNAVFETMKAASWIARQPSMADTLFSSIFHLGRFVAEGYMARSCRMKVGIMKQMPNLSSITIQYHQSRIAEDFAFDPKMMHRALLRFCRFWGNADGKPRWPPLNITITSLESRARNSKLSISRHS